MNRKAGWIGLTLLGLVPLGYAQDSTARQTDLETVLVAAGSYERVPFEVTLLFNESGTIYSPFYTVFEPGTYINFEAWGDTTELWTRNGFSKPHRLFYADRRNRALMAQMLQLEPLTWVRARCVVRSTFGDKAWIEVTQLEPVQGRSLTRSTLRRMARGWSYAEQGEPILAMAEMERVPTNSLPPRFAARFSVTRCEVALAAGDTAGALVALRDARRLDPTLRIASLLDEIRTVRAQETASTGDGFDGPLALDDSTPIVDATDAPAIAPSEPTPAPSNPASVQPPSDDTTTVKPTTVDDEPSSAWDAMETITDDPSTLTETVDSASAGSVDAMEAVDSTDSATTLPPATDIESDDMTSLDDTSDVAADGALDETEDGGMESDEDSSTSTGVLGMDTSDDSQFEVEWNDPFETLTVPDTTDSTDSEVESADTDEAEANEADSDSSGSDDGETSDASTANDESSEGAEAPGGGSAEEGEAETKSEEDDAIPPTETSQEASGSRDTPPPVLDDASGVPPVGNESTHDGGSGEKTSSDER